MEETTKRLSILACTIILLLGSQPGIAANTMDKKMTQKASNNAMAGEQQGTMGAPKMTDGMKNSQPDMMQKNPMMHNDQMKMKSEYSVPSDDELRKTLTPLQYQVTRKEGTEPAFNNTYWDNHEPGLYVDVISGVPLFSSKDKYESGTGWPSFTKPLDPDVVFTKEDRGFFMVRNEVRSSLSDAHLGHVFDDGPQPTGLRYCMNSAALRFVPVADLEKEGYGDYRPLFK